MTSSESVEPVFEAYVKKTEKKDLPGRKVLDYLRKSLRQFKNDEYQSRYIAD